jgi:hypothetical protein
VCWNSLVFRIVFFGATTNRVPCQTVLRKRPEDVKIHFHAETTVAYPSLGRCGLVLQRPQQRRYAYMLSPWARIIVNMHVIMPIHFTSSKNPSTTVSRLPAHKVLPCKSSLPRGLLRSHNFQSNSQAEGGSDPWLAKAQCLLVVLR